MTATTLAPKTRAAEVLAAWLTDAGWRQADLAREVGVHPASVNDWMAGRTTPGLESVVKIARITEGAVSPEMWFEKIDRIST